MTKDIGRARSGQALVASDGAATRLAPSGFDPSRDVFAISASACFCPEDDDPVSYDGSMLSWTFAADKDAPVGAGIYRLQFVRILTPDERNNIPAQRAALAAIAMDARSGETACGLDPKDDSAGPQDIAQGDIA